VPIAGCPTTRIPERIQEGDRVAADELLPLVYSELRTLAAARSAQERPGQTLQATAMVLLQQAKNPGYRNAARMAFDTDLDPLQDQEEFKRLLAELAKPATK